MRRNGGKQSPKSAANNTFAIPSAPPNHGMPSTVLRAEADDAARWAAEMERIGVGRHCLVVALAMLLAHTAARLRAP